MTNEWKFFVPVVLALIALGAITIRQNQRISSLERRLEARVAAETANRPEAGTTVSEGGIVVDARFELASLRARRDPPGQVDK